MGRYIDGIPQEIIDESRQVYRETGSVVAVLRHIRARGFDEMYWDGVLVAVEAFGVGLASTQWLNYWTEDPSPTEYCLTEEELEAKMRPLIEAKRDYWDNSSPDERDPPK